MHDFRIDQELFRTIPADLMLRYGFVPYRRDGRSLVIVVSDPTDLPMIDELGVILGMNKKAREHNVTFEASSASPDTGRDSELEHLKVTFSLSGDYDDVREFIYDVETGPDFVIIDNVLLSEGSDNNAPLRFTFDVSTYYRTGRHGARAVQEQRAARE